MIGNNKMILNNGTMQEAVQLWLDSKTIEPLSKVGWIDHRTDDTFEISLSEIEQ